MPNVACIDIRTDDSWLRDTGPVFLLPREGLADGPAAVAWRWNAWGGKYPPWDADARVARRIAERLGLPVVEPGMVLEGGAIDTDGEGTTSWPGSSRRGGSSPPGSPIPSIPTMPRSRRTSISCGRSSTRGAGGWR